MITDVVLQSKHSLPKEDYEGRDLKEALWDLLERVADQRFPFWVRYHKGDSVLLDICDMVTKDDGTMVIDIKQTFTDDFDEATRLSSNGCKEYEVGYTHFRLPGRFSKEYAKYVWNHLW